MAAVLVSTTLTGSNADIIGPALRSVVPYVDLCLVIDTGATDDTMRVAADVAGEKFRAATFTWCNDFAAARNFALEQAAALGATWAVTVDTDERIITDREGAWKELDRFPDGVGEVRAYDKMATYSKERFIRLPAGGHWGWATHECFVRNEGVWAEGITGIRFDELSKTKEQYQHKLDRDKTILEAMAEADPSDGRCAYYLGQTYHSLNENELAAAAYRRSAPLIEWDEQAGFAMFRAAECLYAVGRNQEGFDAAVEGLRYSSRIPELAWMAALTSYQLGNMLTAVGWAHMSIAIGESDGAGAHLQRSHLRDLLGVHDGPWDVLRFAYRALGDNAEAAKAEKRYEAAKARREAQQGLIRPSAPGRGAKW